MSEQKQPSALDHLQALAMRYEELCRMALPGHLAQDALANASVHATAIKEELDQLRHVIDRQQEELNKADQDGGA